MCFASDILGQTSWHDCAKRHNGFQGGPAQPLGFSLWVALFWPSCSPSIHPSIIAEPCVSCSRDVAVYPSCQRIELSSHTGPAATETNNHTCTHKGRQTHTHARVHSGWESNLGPERQVLSWHSSADSLCKFSILTSCKWFVWQVPSDTLQAQPLQIINACEPRKMPPSHFAFSLEVNETTCLRLLISSGIETPTR